jgi:hypothetical protein
MARITEEIFEGEESVRWISDVASVRANRNRTGCKPIRYFAIDESVLCRARRGVMYTHCGQLGAGLGSFGSLRVALDQRTQLVNAGILLALLDQRVAVAALEFPEKPSRTAL